MIEMSLSDVILKIDNELATITLNRPDTLNALSKGVLEGIYEALNHIEFGEHNIRCLIITGEGRAFSSGANLSETMEGGANENGFPVDVGHQLELSYHPIMRRLRNLHCPIISAVNGPCAGAAVGIALSCDLIMAARSSYFLLAFRNIGLVPDCGVTWIVPRLIGGARARELALLGEKLPAEKAQEWGLINRVFDDETFMEEIEKVARKLAEGPSGQRYIRQVMWDSLDNNFETQLDLERQTQFQAGQTGDFFEGVNAFLEKRQAKFTGK